MKKIIFLILLILLVGSTQVDAQFYKRDIKAATVTASDSMTAVTLRITGTATIPAVAITDIVATTIVADTITASDTLWATNFGATNITATQALITTITATDIISTTVTADTIFASDTLYAENIGADSITANYIAGTNILGTLIGDVTGDVSAATLVASVSTDAGDSLKLGTYWIKPYGTWTGIFEVNGVGDSVEVYATYRNELSPGANPVIVRTGEGIYTITFGSAVLTTSKTLIWVTAGATTPNSYILDAKWTSTAVATIYSGTIANGTAADLIGNISVKIEVIE